MIMKEHFKKGYKTPVLAQQPYNIFKYLSIFLLILILILPWFKLFDLSSDILVLFVLVSGDVFATLLQNKFCLDKILCITLGYAIDIVFSILIFVYVFWASGRMVFD